MSDYTENGGIQVDTYTDTDEELANRWQVILLNDEEHTYEYVIALIQEVFNKDFEEAFDLTHTIDKQGAAVVVTVPKEEAEKYQQKVKSWGADPSMIFSGKMSTGPIQCEIEPVEGA